MSCSSDAMSFPQVLLRLRFQSLHVPPFRLQVLLVSCSWFHCLRHCAHSPTLALHRSHTCVHSMGSSVTASSSTILHDAQMCFLYVKPLIGAVLVSVLHSGQARLVSELRTLPGDWQPAEIEVSPTPITAIATQNHRPPISAIFITALLLASIRLLLRSSIPPL